MGLREFLARRRETSNQRTVERLRKRLMNEHHQTMERKRAIEQLEEIGSPEALYALLGRFSYHTQGSIVDEDEKQMVFDALRRRGADAVPAIEEFIRRENSVYWPVRTLAELAGEERAVQVMFEALDSIQDRWEKSMERMTQLVSCLRDFHLPAVCERLIALAQDESEEIRFLAVDGLTTFDDDPRAVDAILQRLFAADETVRVKTYVTDLLLDRGWNVKKYKKQIMETLPSTYFVDDTGVIQRR